MKWLALLLVLTFGSPVFAASGHLLGGYDALSKQWIGDIEVSQPVGPITFGVTMRTICNDVMSKGVVPSFVPIQQRYDTWLEYHIESVTFRLSDWCNHWLSQSHVTGRDEMGLTMSVRYTF